MLATSEAERRTGAGAPRRPTALLPALAFLGVAAGLLLVQHLSARAAGGAGDLSLSWEGVRRFLASWSQFDGPEYLRIADEGYRWRQLVWFPGYPLAIRGVGAVVGDQLAAAVAVSLAAGLASALLFWRWLGLRGVRGAARTTALLVLLLYPYGWFRYGVVYSDALFGALVLAAFVLLEERRPGWAALAGALATAVRPTGAALVVGLLVLSAERAGALARRLPPPTDLVARQQRVGRAALITRLLILTGVLDAWPPHWKAATAMALGAGGLTAVLVVALRLRGRTDVGWPLLAGVLLLSPAGWLLGGIEGGDLAAATLVALVVVLASGRALPAAGAAAALAIALRPTAALLVLGALLLALEAPGPRLVEHPLDAALRRFRVPGGVRWRRLTPRVLLPAGAAAGLGAYMAWTWVAWGDPLAFATVQRLYHDRGARTFFKAQYWTQLTDWSDPTQPLTMTAQVVVLAGVLLAVPFVGRRFGWGYGAFTLALAAIPLITVGNYMGTGRYLLPAFPVAALVGEQLARRPRARRGWLVGSGLALVVLAALFARSWYLT